MGNHQGVKVDAPFCMDTRQLAPCMNELIDSNPKYRHFFKIDIQEFFQPLICLSADKFWF